MSINSSTKRKRSPEIYHDLYEWSDDIDVNLCCCICLKPLSDPVQHKCNNLVCKKCWIQNINTNNACPTCKQENPNTNMVPFTLPIPFKKLLEECKVICKVCKVEFPSEKITFHYENNCNIQCPYNCGFIDEPFRKLNFRLIDDHIANDCKYASYYCEDKASCGFVGLKSEYDIHIQSCIYYKHATMLKHFFINCANFKPSLNSFNNASSTIQEYKDPLFIYTEHVEYLLFLQNIKENDLIDICICKPSIDPEIKINYAFITGIVKQFINNNNYIETYAMENDKYVFDLNTGKTTTKQIDENIFFGNNFNHLVDDCFCVWGR